MRSVRAAFVALGVVILVVGCVTQRVERTVTVMSFNVRDRRLDEGETRWRERLPAVREAIAEIGADIIGLQEATSPQLDDLLREPYACAGCEIEGPSSNLNAILYRSSRYERVDGGILWLSDTPDVPESTSWGNELPRWATWAHFRERRLLGAGELLVYNTHLDHESERARLESVRLIAHHMADHADGLPVVLMGDFNALPDWPAIQYIIGNGDPPPPLVMRDVVAELNADEDVDGTYHQHTGEPTFDRIDYVFVAGPTTPVSARIVTDTFANDQFPSDHFPVVAILSM